MARLKDNRDVDPRRHIGRWAMTFNHFLFRIDDAEAKGPNATYTGTGLHGQKIVTGFPVEICREEDEEILNAIRQD